MACYVYRDDEAIVSETWLTATREALYEHWFQTTRHGPNRSRGTWACEIANRCRTCNEHLSVPCSLLDEANEIGGFLGNPCYSDDPATFLRLYLIILSEFVGQLKDLAGMMDLQVQRPPKTLCLWANRWAKHRLQILVQHHPGIAFADQYGDRWPRVEARLDGERWEDACGNCYRVEIIDTEWLALHHGSADLESANSESRKLIVVPYFRTFLQETIDYFRGFVDVCLENSDSVRRFESPHFRLC